MAPTDPASPPLDRASPIPNRAGNFHPVEIINAFSRIQPRWKPSWSAEVERREEKEWREMERSGAACGGGGGDEESSPARGEGDVNGVGEPGFANFLVPHRIPRKKTTALYTAFRGHG
jgi:hypothetical protein